MLQFVARQLGNLVGKGLPWRVIGEFFVLSLPFTVAMTLPMAVLVATLHAFGRMANEHEITAFKASGVRVTTLMWPVIVGSAVLALGMVVFNDQVLPRANHRLRILQQDMARTKPTFALNEQVLNQITPGFYMRIGRLDRASNRMTDVTIYDLSAPFAHKTIYADSGDLAVTPDQKDLQLMLFDGFQQELKGDAKNTLQRVYFRSQAVRVKDVAGGFEQTGNDDWKGDREKSVCEMQTEYVGNAREYERVRQLYIIAASKAVAPGQKTVTAPRPRPATGGLAKMYCNGLALVFRTQTAIPSDQPVQQPVTAANPSQVAPVAGVPGQPAPDGTPGVAAVALSPEMQAQLDAAKASLAAPVQAGDSLAQQAERARQVVARQQAQQAAHVAAQQALQKGTRPVALPPIATAGGDSDHAQAVVLASKHDSTAPATPPASVPNPGQLPPAATTAAATATTTASTTAAPLPAAVAGQPAPARPAPGQPVTGQPVTGQPTPGQPVSGQPGAGKPSAGQPTPAPVVVPPVANPAAAVGTATPGVPITSASATAIDPAAGAALIQGSEAELSAARSQLTLVRASMDSLAVEIQKKFALSFACIVFVLFGPPIALRFPRGGVGATLGISLVVFGLYYICLMAGETLADDGQLPPIVAMWIANVIFTIAGLLLLLRIEKTADASRGGGIRAWFEERRMRRANRRAVRATDARVAV